MAYESSLHPEWSWSFSRRMTLEECTRKYYYHYYASHNGWQENINDDTKEIYRLKQLKNLYLVFGDAVHRVAEMVVRRWHHTNQIPSTHELVDQIRIFLNRAYKESLNQTQWWKQPTRRMMLNEIYYNGDLPIDVVRQIKDRIELCVSNFLRSTSMQEYTNNPYAKLIEVEKLNHTYIDGTKVYVKIDFMYRVGDTYIITDWKTGREDSRYDDQLILYAYYVHQIYEVPLDDIEIRTEYLLNGECSNLKVTSSDLERLLSNIRMSISRMKSYLDDFQQNVPRPVEHFPGVTNPIICNACNFRGVCDVKTRLDD